MGASRRSLFRREQTPYARKQAPKSVLGSLTRSASRLYGSVRDYSKVWFESHEWGPIPDAPESSQASPTEEVVVDLKTKEKNPSLLQYSTDPSVPPRINWSFVEGANDPAVQGCVIVEAYRQALANRKLQSTAHELADSRAGIAEASKFETPRRVEVAEQIEVAEGVDSLGRLAEQVEVSGSVEVSKPVLQAKRAAKQTLRADVSKREASKDASRVAKQRRPVTTWRLQLVSTPDVEITDERKKQPGYFAAPSLYASDSEEEEKGEEVEKPTFKLPQRPTSTPKLWQKPALEKASNEKPAEKPSAEKPVFSFNKSAEAAPGKTEKPAFSFSPPEGAAKPADNPAFSFGSSNGKAKEPAQNDKPQNKSEKPAFSFASSVDKPAPKASFNFGTPGDKPPKPAEPAAEKPAFSFGKPAEPAAEKPAFSFGKPAEPAAEKPAFSFGKPAEPAEKPTEKATFSFGKPADTPKPGAPAAKPAEKLAFNFGKPPTPAEKPAAAPAFTFGKSAETPAANNVDTPADKPVDKPAGKPAAFTFGGPATASTDKLAPTFGQPAKTTEKPTFSFGSTNGSADKAGPSTEKPAETPKFTFGASNPGDKPATAFTFNAPGTAQIAAPKFDFSANPSGDKPAAGFSNTPPMSGTAPTFTFGKEPSNGPKASTPFSFVPPANPMETGQPLGSATTAGAGSTPLTPAFTFGSTPSAFGGALPSAAAPTAGAAPFGNPSNGTGSAFGSKAMTPQPAFTFGAPPAAPFQPAAPLQQPLQQQQPPPFGAQPDSTSRESTPGVPGIPNRKFAQVRKRLRR